MGFMYEFPHSRMFDSDLREILEFFNGIEKLIEDIKDLPERWAKFKQEMIDKYGSLENLVRAYLNDPNTQEQINSMIADLLVDVNVPLRFGIVTPQMFGAKGDGVNDDTMAFQQAFDYLHETRLSFQPGNTIYTGYNLKLFIPTGVYKISDSIYVKGGYPLIEGNRAIITTSENVDIFKMMDADGWNFNICGISFIGGKNALYFNSSNLEMGNTTIEKCWFYDQSECAIYLQKQSQLAVIRDCKFYRPVYTLYMENVDRLIFEDNWISEKGREKSKDATIIAKSMVLILRNNIFVPERQIDGVNETAYINAHCTVRAIDNHFGGEVGSKTIINVMEDFPKPSDGSVGNPTLTTIEVSNSERCYTVFGDTAVRLFALPTNLIVKGNLGFNDYISICNWGDGVNITNLINEVSEYLQIDVNLNNGYAIKHRNMSQLMPNALLPFCYNYGMWTNIQSEVKDKQSIKVDANTLLIKTKYTEINWMGKPLLITLMLRSETGQDLYRSTITGIISFISYFNGSNVLGEAIFTPLINQSGGFPGNYHKEEVVNIVFNDSGTTTTTNLSNPEGYEIKITTDKEIIDFSVQSLFEGTNRY